MDPCKFHKNGHCRSKTSCILNHNIPHCPQGRFCPQKSDCQFRHVKRCPLFPKCPYPTCSYYHPPPIPPLFPHPPPWPIPPKVRPLLADPMANRRIQSLEVLVQKLKTDLSSLGTELAAIKSKNNNKDEPEDKSASEKEDDHLEVTPEVSPGGILGLRDITEEAQRQCWDPTRVSPI